jgi:hypothetical protein
VDIPVNAVWVGFRADDELVMVLLEVGVKVDVVGSSTAAAVVLDGISIGISSTTAEDCMELLETIVLELLADEVLLEVGKTEAAFSVWQSSRVYLLVSRLGLKENLYRQI